MVQLTDNQIKARDNLKSGSILYGGVGSGKTFTSLSFAKERYSDRDIYVITTAKKRDSGDWEDEASQIGVELTAVDSWNNITNYNMVKNAFFIFDEQRAVGYGTWGRALIKIARQNDWVMCTATPGDTWMDYLVIFIANGFYKNRKEFVDQHVEYDPWVKFPKIKKFHNQGKLAKLRHSVLVPIKVDRHTTRKRVKVKCDFNKEVYSDIAQKRWNIYTREPIKNAPELLSTLRHSVNADKDRIFHAKWLADMHDKVIIFYNFDYELEILRTMAQGLDKPYSEWNGHLHEPIPDADEWLYLVQYTSGAEGWNCTETDTMIFYSLNYSYKIVEQAEGRIDRMNTPFKELTYFYLVSDSSIDKSIEQSVESKKIFNQSGWLKKEGIIFD